MIDAVGGVTVTIDNRAIDDPRYDWLDGRRGFTLSAGKHKLNGEDALAYVRSRTRPATTTSRGPAASSRSCSRCARKLDQARRCCRADAAASSTSPATRSGRTSRPNRIGEMIDLAQRVDTDKVRQVVLGPTVRRSAPYSETGGIYNRSSWTWTSSAELSIDQVFGGRPTRRPPLKPPRAAADGARRARSATLEHRRDRPEHDLEVEPDRPAVDVGEVELDPAVEVLVAATLDLPQPGDARASSTGGGGATGRSRRPRAAAAAAARPGSSRRAARSRAAAARRGSSPAGPGPSASGAGRR